jgi:hypothetical protein
MPRIVALGSWGRHGWSDSGDVAGGLGRGSGWGGSRVRLGPFWVLTCGGEMAGRHGRRSQVAAGVGAGAPASLRSGLGNRQWKDLLQCLGEMPERLDGRENMRAWELGIDSNHGADGGALVVVRERGSCPFIGGRARRFAQRQVIGTSAVWAQHGGLCARSTAATPLGRRHGRRGRPVRVRRVAQGERTGKAVRHGRVPPRMHRRALAGLSVRAQQSRGAVDVERRE